MEFFILINDASVNQSAAKNSKTGKLEKSHIAEKCHSHQRHQRYQKSHAGFFRSPFFYLPSFALFATRAFALSFCFFHIFYPFLEDILIIILLKKQKTGIHPLLSGFHRKRDKPVFTYY